MGAMMCIMHNAGEERALAAGLVKSLLGLGAAVFSQVRRMTSLSAPLHLRAHGSHAPAWRRA